MTDSQAISQLKKQLRRAIWIPLVAIGAVLLCAVAFALNDEQRAATENVRSSLRETIEAQAEWFTSAIERNDKEELKGRVTSILNRWREKYPPCVNACVRLEYETGKTLQIINQCSREPAPHEAPVYETRKLELSRQGIATVSTAVIVTVSMFDFFPVILFLSILIGIFATVFAHYVLVSRVEARVLLPLLNKMREDEKNAAVAEATQMIAHDVRKPFQIVRLAVQRLIRSKNVTASKIGRAVNDEVESSIRSVNAMLTDIIDIGRELNPCKETLSVRELIHSSLSAMLRSYPEAITRLQTTFENSTAISADREQLFRVLTNLIENAIHATHSHGRIHITARNILISGRAFVEVSIQNDGNPLNVGDQAKMFKPYFTTKKNGTGLGLAITKKIVTANGGEIVCHTCADSSTVFSLRIPANETVDRYGKELSSTLSRLSEVSVLIFGDEQAVPATWRLFANEQDFQTICYFQSWEDFVAQDALQFAKGAIALIDLHYANSKFNGIEMARFLRTLGAMRVYAMTSDRDAARASGAFDDVFGKDVPGEVVIDSTLSNG